MNDLFGRVLFEAGAKTYLWEDVFLFAQIAGDWPRFLRRLSRRLSCMKYLEEKGWELNEEEVDTLATEFREARNLIAAEEMEQWLEARHLTVDDWIAFIERNVAQEMCKAKRSKIAQNFQVSTEEMNEVLVADGICSGAFSAFIRKLAGRAALFLENNGDASSAPAEEAQQLLSVLPEPGLQPVAGSLSAEELKNKLDHLVKLELFFRKFWKDKITADVLKEEIQSHSLDLVRFQLDSLSFSEEAPAREAALCVREDGMSIAEVAADANATVDRETFYLREVNPDLQDLIIGAKPGDLIGPFQNSAEQFQVLSVVEKQTPSLKDRDIRKRAAQSYQKRVLEHAINAQVKWRNIL
jgi:hypothetical protein